MAVTITLSDSDVKIITDNVYRDLALAIVRDAIRKAQSASGISSGDPARYSTPTYTIPCTCGTTAGCLIHPRNSPYNTTSSPIRDDHTRDLSSDAAASTSDYFADPLRYPNGNRGF